MQTSALLPRFSSRATFNRIGLFPEPSYHCAMSFNVQQRGKRFQLRVKHALLHKPFFFTFDSHDEAAAYGEVLDSVLSRGIVPSELLAGPVVKADDPLVIEVIRAYSRAAHVAPSDSEVLDVLVRETPGLRVSGVTFAWCDAYVQRLKRVSNLAPGTIRKRVGSLARVLDWHIRQTTAPGAPPQANALRLLPRGYSAYTPDDVAAGAKPKRDVVRNRRLAPDECARILQALAGHKRPDRQRALEVDPAFALLFDLIVDTGLRLFEAYRLRVTSVDFAQGVINVEGSKGHHGVIKPRVVPLKPALREKLRAWCDGRVGLVFPFWDGSPGDKDLASGRLTARFAVLFDYAGVPDFREHDLRHEATCRWVELRNATGWVFSEIEICRIMGWSDTRMMLRYASLRGSDLASRLA